MYGVAYGSNHYAGTGDDTAYINVSEAISIVDTKVFSISFLTSEIVSISESLSTIFGQTLYVLDTIGINENLVHSISARFTDTISVVERFVASISVFFTEIVSVFENIVSQLTKPFAVIARILDSPRMKAGVKAFRTIGNTRSKEYNGNVKSSDDFKGGVKPYSDRGGVK